MEIKFSTLYSIRKLLFGPVNLMTVHFWAFQIGIVGLGESSAVGAWRSLVAHLFWVQGVVSSNLAAPTTFYIINNYGYIYLSDNSDIFDCISIPSSYLNLQLKFQIVCNITLVSWVYSAVLAVDCVDVRIWFVRIYNKL